MAEWVEQLREAARRALPPVEGEVDVPGLSGPVEVIRDRWGVPHIYAQDLDDLFAAQGFVVASERLFQIDMMLRMANGRLASMFADLMLPMDRFIRTLGWNRAGARVAAGWDDRSRHLMAAFRGGVAAWIESMPARPVEYEILDLEPQVPVDDDAPWAAGFVLMAWILSGNWDMELLRAEIADRLGWEAMLALLPGVPPDPSVVVPGKRDGRRALLEMLKDGPRRPPGIGSNNWVVAGSRTVTGKPLLANDPHLNAQMPSIWIECHLSARGYEASGVALPFSPGVIIGHTPHHAWGLTNVGGDTQDLYLERLSNDRTAALYDGEWEPLTIHREEIEVRGTPDPVVLEVRETRHGPVVDSYAIGIGEPTIVEGGIRETYALRWVGHQRAFQPSTLLDIATAADFGEFRGALRTLECPGQNVVYADVDGTIGYQCTGLYPVRRKGDGTIPAPGWTADHEWDGWIPFEELPWAENPDEGFLATANQRIHDDAYPYLIGVDFLPSFRARRVVELLTATERHSAETFARIQADTVSIPARDLILPHLAAIVPENDLQKEALSHLTEWDGDLARDSAAAVIYQVWCVHLARRVLLPKLGEELFAHYYSRREWTNAFQFQALPSLLRYPTATWFGADGPEARDDVLRASLDDAVAELTQSLGEDMGAWRWGALHKVVFAHPLALIPDLAPMFTGGVVEVGGDEQTISQSAFEPGHDYRGFVVPSWRQIVDLADLDASVGTQTTGQSGHPASPHWNDLVPLWGGGEYHPLPLSRAAVEAAAETTLTLRPTVP